MRPASESANGRSASRSLARAPLAVVAALSVAVLSGDARVEAAKRKPASRPGEIKARTGKRARGNPALALVAPLRRSAGPSVEPSRDERRSERTSKQPKSRRVRKSAKPEPDRWPPMQLEAVNTKERLNIRLYDRRGHTVRSSARRLWHLMRCHLTGKQKPIHARLIRSLYKVARHYPGRTLYVYSGYRARRVASLRSSNHVKGRAVDFRVAGVSNRALRDYLLSTFKPSGIGYYPNAPFVHFDVREKQSAFWVDHSGKGEAAEYASNPYAEVKREKAAPKSKSATRAPGAVAEPAPGADEPVAEKSAVWRARGGEPATDTAPTDESSGDDSRPARPGKAPGSSKGREADVDTRGSDTAGKPEPSPSDDHEPTASRAAPP